MRRHLGWIILFATLLLALISLTIGSSKIGLFATIGVFTGHNTSATQRYIIINLRLVRIIASFCAGMILSLGGVSYQAVLRNPMADPFILGVSSGSSFGVALAIYFGLASRFGLPLFAMAGATGTTLFILALASRKRSSNTVLLLSGVAANYILSAAMTLLLFLNREQYQRILAWSLGTFSTATWNHVVVAALISLLLFLFLYKNHRNLDLLLLDEGSARSSGLAVESVRYRLLLISSFATALCVSFFGVIGFIGLMAPHITRLILGAKHQRLILPTALAGGFLLLLSDTLARVFLPSGELPVGIITSLLGVPLFLFLILKGRYRFG
ncbi:MAG: iron ABC transporter permease [Spirochaetales bacterium]|jgi:iron complex transport system permease protein|nr:iron ABC transporter permease [Spirochaetales bacterium]